MYGTVIRPAEERDYNRILELNARDVAVLSPMDDDKLRKMAACTELFQVAEVDGVVAAFIMVFRERSGYWGENYRWFEDHYDEFLYVDRIVVDENYRRLHIAGKIYEEAIQYGHANGVPCITAEIDIEPFRNEPSLRFHSRMGFHEVGTKMFGATIRVSLQKLDL